MAIEGLPELNDLPHGLAEEIDSDPKLVAELIEDRDFQENLSCEMVDGVLVTSSVPLSPDAQEFLGDYLQFLRERRAKGEQVTEYYHALDENDPANQPTDDETRTQPPFPKSKED